MRSTLQRIWLRDKHTRDANKLRKKRNICNWPIHRDKALEVFRAFAQVTSEANYSQFEIVESGSRPEFSGDWGIFHYGEDNICLNFKDRPTGHWTERVQQSGKKEIVKEIESGAGLVIYHSSHNGYVQIFFAASEIEERKRSARELLMSYHSDMDELTPHLVMTLIRKFLIFARVDSSLENASWLEQLRVRWWRFVDARNRKSIKGDIDVLLTPWEKLILVALASFVTFIIGVYTSEETRTILKTLNPFL
ncbi:MAG: hypothetical protein Q7J46_14290 [Pseudomonas sp.]|nr:hypothetical protein [Pseudomonas sp.]